MSRAPDTISRHAPSAHLRTESSPEHSLLRVKQRKRGWIPISRSLIDDPRLQFDTRGVASWLLAKPDGWQIRIGVLPHLLQQRAGPGERVGRDRLRRILRELEGAGYLTRARCKTKKGRWTWRIEFSDSPTPSSGISSTMDGSAVYGSPVDGSAAGGSGVDLLNTLSNSIVDNLITTTTLGGDLAGKGAVLPLSTDLRYPIFMQGVTLASARRVIESCQPDQRQAVLDEIGEMHVRGKVRSPLGLLNALVRSAAAGQFVPNLSAPVGPKSTPKQRPSETLSRSTPSSHPAPRSAVLVSEVGHETVSRLREMLQTKSE